MQTSNPYLSRVVERVTARMYGLDDVLRLLLVALYSRGHVLLEGNPGLGKTTLVKELCSSLGFRVATRFGRIQFTPDLLPADITGTKMPRDDDPSRFEFQPGPIFHWLLLADEINRATPKTQSAMLEAMGERQVTVLDERRELFPAEQVSSPIHGYTGAVRPPFFVLATQNPIDQEGTYDLPEAQADRFMMKLQMPSPGRSVLCEILRKEAGTDARGATGVGAAIPVAHDESEALFWYQLFQAKILEVVPAGVVEEHVLNMVQASNADVAGITGLSDAEAADAAAFARRYIEFGLGPRAATSLMLGAKAWAMLFAPGDGQHTPAGLAEVALPTIRHRLMLQPDWEDELRRELTSKKSQGKAASPAPTRDGLLVRFILLTAPAAEGYREALRKRLERGRL